MRNFKKIVTVAELKKLIQGRKIALAHGVFDVFHIGHLKHLEVAKQNADILIVSITSDRYVRKGPSRPYFSENIRAEFLSSIEIVDFIVINDDVTSINLINTIKPDIYVKGKDYQNPSKDITGNISLEKKAVKKNGGKILITEEIEFSSSKIINEFIQPPKIMDSLKDIEKIRNGCIDAVNSLKNLKVLVLGELIFDEYNFVNELDKPGKENIQSVIFKKRETYLGGAFSIAKNISSYVSKVDYLCVGNLNNVQKKYLKKESSNVSNLNLKLYMNEFNSITKKRYVNGSNRKLFEEYEMIGDKFCKDKFYLEKLKNLKKYDLVILADFGHGLISGTVIKSLYTKTNFLAVNAQTNSENRGYNYITKYKKADYICIDRQEIRLALSDRHSNISHLIKKLFEKIKTNIITVTLGREGIMITKREKKKFNKFILPGFEVNPIDTLGAGDAVFGISSLLLRKKVDLKLVALISNLVGAMKTKIVGHSSTITKKDLIKSLTYTLK
tara:strand:- start:75 stop:1574 length:1500 start_codon:yes stop_codon:yes gene_type:complete